ncbi:MAG TPA: HAD-IIA family hydrolase [Solirubrobacteraceae bacterium]|nr:HAD-IIA family hydrolase [Solirubrobacteraceae bacterium]
MPLSPFLRDYDHVLLDLDGCVWVGDEPTERAVEAVAALREAGRGPAFVTNDARHAGEEFVRKLWRLGFQASLEEVVTVGGALQHWLAGRRDRAATAYVIGSAAIWRHVEDAGLRIVNDTDLATRADLVIVAGHDDFDYAELRGAVQALARGAGLVTAGRDPTFPMPEGPWPGTGALIAAVETASGAQAVNLGKPAPALCAAALDRRGASADRTLVVGDRLDADLAGAAAASLDAAIVLTGATDRARAEAAKDPKPVAIAESLGDLLLGPRHA